MRARSIVFLFVGVACLGGVSWPPASPSHIVRIGLALVSLAMFIREIDMAVRRAR